jgi:hypothetical protein
MLSNNIILFFFSLISVQVCVVEDAASAIKNTIVSPSVNIVQEDKIYLNSIFVNFNDASPYQKVKLTILGQDIALERNNTVHVFDQRLLIDPTKNLRVSYDLFPGETNLGIMMIDKSKLKANSEYDLHVDIGDRGAYAVKLNLKKR